MSLEPQLEKNPALWELFDAIARLETPQECAHFLRDLCTLQELQAQAERWQVARLVDVGMPYRKVAEEVGASTATVSRVAHWLRHGQGGYRMMLDRLDAAGAAPGRSEGLTSEEEP